MKYVLVGPVYPYRGGIAHFTTKLARTFEKRDSLFHVISFHRQYPLWFYPGKSDRDPSQEPLLVNAEYLLDPLYPWTWWLTAHKIAEWDPYAVIFQWWSTFWAPAFSALAFLLRKRGIKIFYVIHNVMPHEPRLWDRWLARLALRQGHHFLLLTGHEKERLLSLLPQAQTTVVPLPIFDMFADQRIPIAEAKQRLGLPADEAVALFFGLVRPYKGLKFVIEALAELHLNGKTVHLLVAGEFWEDEQTYIRLIEQLALSPQVKIYNRYIPNEEVGLYFSAADVFVAPYVSGTQSAAVKVALGFDLPVVISRAIASEELENDAYHRLYWIDPKDVHALAVAIDRSLLENITSSGSITSSSGIDEWEQLVDKIESMG